MAFFDGISGSTQDAFIPELTIIPNNTTARAQITLITIVEKHNKYVGDEKYIEVSWKILDGDFKAREVKQKIKCFVGDDNQLKRARNMLMLLLNLCDYKIPHEGEPTVFDLLPLTGKILGIKIREWSMEKQDGSGTMEGNFISEIHSADDKFMTETGIKSLPKSPRPKSPSAQSGIPNIADDLDDSIPF